MTENNKSSFEKLYDKNYKKLLIIPLLLVILSLVYMGYFYSQNQDFIYKDVSLTGGTSITINDKSIDINEMQIALEGKLEDFNARKVYDLITNEQKAIIIETHSEPDVAASQIEEYLGYELTQENSSIEFTGSILSENFYKQLLLAILIAFIFMAFVVFLLFRTIVPSSAVIIAAFADILMTLVVVNLIGMRISTAGIIAFLMLIGYSVDTDILLTNRMVKRKKGSPNQRLFGAFQTGIMMSITSLIAISCALIFVYSFSNSLAQIFTILIIGLGFDIFNTWITNASLIKWYVEAKK